MPLVISEMQTKTPALHAREVGGPTLTLPGAEQPTLT